MNVTPDSASLDPGYTDESTRRRSDVAWMQAAGRNPGIPAPGQTSPRIPLRSIRATSTSRPDVGSM